MQSNVPNADVEPVTTSDTVITEKWLRELARKIAAQAVPVPNPINQNYLPVLLKSLGEYLTSVHHYFEETSGSEASVSNTAEWMLDNFYLIEQTLRQVGEDISPKFFERLPKVRIDGQETLRIFTLALILTKTTDSRLGIDQIQNFIEAFQSITPLQIGENWALPPMLRLSILETLVDALVRITKLNIPPLETLDEKYPVVINLWAESSGDRRLTPRVSDETIVVNCFLSLRMLATQNWHEFFEIINVVDSILRKDPAGVYSQMDFETRNRYRNSIEELASHSHFDQAAIASEALNQSQNGVSFRAHHVGYYLIGPGRHEFEKLVGYRTLHERWFRKWLTQYSLPIYLTSIISLTLILCTALASYAIYAGGSLLQIILAFALTLFPASAVAVDFVNWRVTQIVPPRRLPRLNFKEGIPAESGVMVVIPSLLKNESELNSLLDQLENHYLGNTDPNIRFALLTDYVDAPEKELPGESELIQKAKDGIDQLNLHYGNEGVFPFYLFHRERSWNASEDCWMGWERKRGKLEDFNKLILGKDTGNFSFQVGDLSCLSKIRFVVTLDADTTLPRDSVRQFAGILAHPLNQAEFDEKTGMLRDGYAVIQPRLQVRPNVANRSIFTRVFSGDMTLDLYTRAVSDVYQDLFGEGSYVGKGIYDVAAFEKCLDGRIPDNMLLSHDLFEGMYSRCGLASDITLFEDYPTHYLAFSNRLHRWIRGDWQLLPWLQPQVPHKLNGKIQNTLSGLSLWKIIDNLRRSLVSPFTLAFLISGWFLLPGITLVWTLLALSPIAFSILIGLISSVRARGTDQFPETTSRPVQQALLYAFFEIVFLTHKSLVVSDAIVTTIYRMTITHKRLLQWVTAAHVINIFGKELKVQVAWREMFLAPIFSILLFVLAWLVNPIILWVALPFLVLWILSPQIAAKISQPIYREQSKITPQQETSLRQLARSTWLFFEKFVGPDDHWLPPDHFQEDPLGLIAHRTSPTNIGLLLLSTLSAWDLGYIGPREIVIRVQNTLDGMDNLNKERGHLLNWYDTRTLAPLTPRYISTVDNGNLAACLVTLRQGCRDIADKPIIRWEGLIDTLDVLDTTLSHAHLGKDAIELHKIIANLREKVNKLHHSDQFNSHLLVELFQESRTELEELLTQSIKSSTEQLDADTIRGISVWIERVHHHMFQVRQDIEILSPWALTMFHIPPFFSQNNLSPDLSFAWQEFRSSLPFNPILEEIPNICSRSLSVIDRIVSILPLDEEDAISWCHSMAIHIKNAQEASSSLINDLNLIYDRIDTYIEEMNFNFLYNAQRKVFHIGYNVDNGQLDSSYYDLLASEARLTSLLAIAKGDVPQNHWLHLARPITQVNGARILLSWSATMFEYLMPELLTQHYPDTLLEQSCRGAVDYQISYGQSKHVPWGISESGFYYFDNNQAYQYRAFGVPGLGFKRVTGDDLVISPYASMLALPFATQSVLHNLEHLKKLNMVGLYGLYEAVDFTAERLSTGQDYAIVRSYMAHHQGMILLSLCNSLCGKSMIRRFHSDPRVETVKILLQEQTPIRAPIERIQPKMIGTIHPIKTAVSLDAWEVKPEAPHPQVHYLSNGNYSLLITAAGSGFSRWHDIDLTRWRADATLDQYGSWIYIKNRETHQFWSAGFQPTSATPQSEQIKFYPHTVEFLRSDGELSTRTQIVIAPNVDVEIRLVTLTNHSAVKLDLELTSYSEVILSLQSADERHPAYNKLFIESEYIESEKMLLFRRRPRSAEEKPVYLAHFLIGEKDDFQIAGYETDRDRFIGRGNTQRNPSMIKANLPLSNSSASLDPILAMQSRVQIEGYESQQIAFVTLAAPSRSKAIELAHRFDQLLKIKRTFSEARSQTEQELIQTSLTTSQIEQYQKLLSAILYPSSEMRADSETIASNTLGQSGLWPFAISGDYPILLLRVKNEENLELLSDLLHAHAYWRRRGLMIDFIILNQRANSYDQSFQGKIYRLLPLTNSDDWLGKRGGIFILNEDQIPDSERILIETTARVILNGEMGTLTDQLQKLDQSPIRLPAFVPILPLIEKTLPLAILKRPTDLLFDNGLGGFSPDGREYIIYLDRDHTTPAPWSNVIANPEFGCLVSESGMGCTWAGNSSENRLTPWHNDPVSDPPSEAVYLRDEDTGQVWSPTPLPANDHAPYLIRHGSGYTIFEHNSHQLEQKLKVFVAPDAPVKIVTLIIKNTTSRTRRINITYFAEWVLGSSRENMAPYIIPEFESASLALLANNPYNQEFGKRVAFLAATRELQGLTTDRAEFLGSMGNYAHPLALDRVGLTANIKAGNDACAAIQLLLWLAPNETKEVSFLLGEGQDREDALSLITHYQNLENIEKTWNSLEGFWDDQIGNIQVKTPDPAMDQLVNRWLPYQALSCRIWGRTAFYQSGGAFGFRDQLQDVLAFTYTKPEIPRQFILKAAAHQFVEGDVLHWWHPPGDKGIRTRISDNMLWLPFVTAQYIHATGDQSILDEQVSFLTGDPLKEGEYESYGKFPTGVSGTLFEHCRRAISKGSTAGKYGLPLMGDGDWNDGMNKVGAGGIGESVWLGWFLYSTLISFAEVCKEEQAAAYHKQAEILRISLENSSWDGNWFRRAYYDDGKPLGSIQNNDCQIDSISQSWSVISGAGEPPKTLQAMESLYQRLVRTKDGLILLLTPPFDRSLHDPGYIKGYLPGIRENGGQYTHAAIWAIWAFAELGQNERVSELFNFINPIQHSDTPDKIALYRVEPYIIAADVYSAPQHLGRGGWTWYTGSASWMYRLGVEKILGLQLKGKQLTIKPCVPAGWNEFEIHYRFGKSLYHIHVDNLNRTDTDHIKYTLDGNSVNEDHVTLADDGNEHILLASMA